MLELIKEALCILEPSQIKNRTYFRYYCSIIFLFVATLFGEVLFTLSLQYITGFSLLIIGNILGAIGFLFLGVTWLNQSSIPAWAGSGSDSHPLDSNRLLLGNEYKNFCIVNQPNRYKMMLAVYVLSIAQLIGITEEFIDTSKWIAEIALFLKSN